MMRALFAGISGLRTHQVRMDVIGNNIANVNTVGFKKSTVTFKNQFYETINSASAPNSTSGGTNAKQIGLGVSVGTIVTKHTPGNTQYTGATLDLAIDGDGFFVVKTPKGNAFTRAGNFALSNDGSFVDPMGNFVQCAASQHVAATAPATGFVFQPVTVAGAITPATLKIDKTQVGSVSVDESGAVTGLLLEDHAAGDVVNGITLAGPMKMGEKIVVGYIALATFNNPEGLDKVSNNMYQANQNSGDASMNLVNQNGAGSIIPSSLEMSNVDLSEEMVSMIIAQRGFQANSRIITTTDSMLEELVNLKR